MRCLLSAASEPHRLPACFHNSEFGSLLLCVERPGHTDLVQYEKKLNKTSHRILFVHSYCK